MGCIQSTTSVNNRASASRRPSTIPALRGTSQDKLPYALQKRMTFVRRDELFYFYNDPPHSSTRNTIDYDFFLEIDNRKDMFGFNSVNLYRSLCRATNCKQVDIHSIKVKNNDRYCLGMQVTYRQTFQDGTAILTSTPMNYSNNGYYSGDIGHDVGPVSDKVFTLNKGEYLTGVYLQQGEIVDGITFITNKRTLDHVGGRGGDFRILSTPSTHKMKIVAFAGSYKGVLKRIAFYATNNDHKWETVKDYLLLRELVKQKRASRIGIANTTNGSHAAIQWLCSDETPFELTREVLSFL